MKLLPSLVILLLLILTLCISGCDNWGEQTVVSTPGSVGATAGPTISAHGRTESPKTPSATVLGSRLKSTATRAVPRFTSTRYPRNTIVLPTSTATPSIFGIIDLSFPDPLHGWALGWQGNPSGRGRVTTKPASLRSSMDGGETWQALPAPSTSIQIGHDITTTHEVRNIRFANNMDGWAFNPGLFATHDGGKTWVDESRSRSIALIEPKDQSVWAIERACTLSSGTVQCDSALLTSVDMGRTWERPSIQPKILGWKVHLIRYDANEAILFSSGRIDIPQQGSLGFDIYYDSLLLSTRDGGKSWQELTKPPPTVACSREFLQSPVRGQLWYLCVSTAGAGQEGKYLYQSMDGGKTWVLAAWGLIPWTGNEDTDSTNTITRMGYVSSFAVPSQERGYMTIDGWGVYWTTDGGRTWNPPIGDDGTGRGSTPPGQFIFLDSSHGWLTFLYYNQLFRTTDGGATWSESEIP